MTVARAGGFRGVGGKVFYPIRRFILRPKSWYGKLTLRKSISDINSSGATLRELTDAVGQDAATQYIEGHR